MRGSMSLEADINDMILKLPHGQSVGVIENGRGEFSDGAMQEDLTRHFLFPFSFCFSFSYPLFSFFQDQSKRKGHGSYDLKIASRR